MVALQVTLVIFLTTASSTNEEIQQAIRSTVSNLDELIEIMEASGVREGAQDFKRLRDFANEDLVSPPREKLQDIEWQFRTILKATGVGEKLIEAGLLSAEILGSIVVRPSFFSHEILPPRTKFYRGEQMSDWHRNGREAAQEIAVAIYHNDPMLKLQAFVNAEGFWTDFYNWFNTTRPDKSRWSTSDAPSPRFWETLERAGIHAPRMEPFNRNWLASILKDKLNPITIRYYKSRKRMIFSDIRKTLGKDYPCKINLAAIGVKVP
jgi:hypothetical protein